MGREHVAQPRQALAFTSLDQGEAEVLALALERSTRLVVLDEWKARVLAGRLNLPLTGTLGLLLSAKEVGLIEAVASFSVMTHFESFQRGIIDTRDVVFYLAVMAFCLFTTSVIIRSHRAG